MGRIFDENFFSQNQGSRPKDQFFKPYTFWSMNMKKIKDNLKLHEINWGK